MNKTNKFKIFYLICGVFLNFVLHSQDKYVKYNQITKIGNQIFEDVLKGNFSSFNKNERNKYPLDSSSIIKYRQDLTKQVKGIRNLRSIEKANKDSLFFYQMVVFNASLDSPVIYYFVVGLMFYVNNSSVELVNNWIITENSSFREWWQHTMSFFMSNDFMQLPKEFKYEVCPPPPDNK
jgi:hypothetical protein